MPRYYRTSVGSVRTRTSPDEDKYPLTAQLLPLNPSSCQTAPENTALNLREIVRGCNYPLPR